MVNRRCRTCLRKEKIFRVDLNLFNAAGKTKIKYKNCKRRTGRYCVVLILDKILIRV